MRIKNFWLAALLAGALVACGDDDNNVPRNDQPAGADEIVVSIRQGAMNLGDEAYDPSTATIDAGTTVTWVNNDSMPHTVTARDGSFDSEQIQPGGRFSHTFDEAGEFDYFCELHPSMTGTVVVEGTSTQPTPTPSMSPSPTPTPSMTPMTR